MGLDDAAARDGMRWIAGGSFRMGSERAYPEEGPVHSIAVDGFWIDIHLVTNAAFSRFVDDTLYVTSAERPIDPADFPAASRELPRAGGIVFWPPSDRLNIRDFRNWWRYVPGANWRHPDGPDSTIVGNENDPVVQIDYADALAYAAWAGKRLPTEQEWEFAARGGLEGATYCWGEDMTPGGRFMANTWQGRFPAENTGADGFAGRSPVAAFPPNGYGLFDMAGNVWEWTTTDFSARHVEPSGCGCGGAADRKTIGQKVIKGGSYLCAPNYCLRYRPSARQPQSVDSATCHIGFRCVCA